MIFPHKNVPFWGSIHIAPHLHGHIPQNPSWGRERHFEAKSAKLAYYCNYCIDSNQILYNDKVHKVHIVGGLNTCLTRWQPYSKKKSAISEQPFDRSSRNFVRWWRTDIWIRMTIKNAKKIIIQNCKIHENLLNYDISTTFWPISVKFRATVDHSKR